MRKTEEQMGKCPTCGSLIKIIKRRAVPKETYVPDEPEAAENTQLREHLNKVEYALLLASSEQDKLLKQLATNEKEANPQWTKKEGLNER